MTDPQLTREDSDAINARIRDAAGKNPGDLVLARDVHQFIAGLDAEIARLRAELDAKRVDPDAVHYARIGSAHTACRQALPQIVPWSAEQYDFGSPKLTSLRENATCPRCRFNLGLDRTGGSS